MLIRQYPLNACTPMTGRRSIQTRVLEAGSGREVAICIHGVGSRADRFAPTLAPLAEAGYHAYAIDLPGHGFADKGALPLSVPFFAAFMADIIAQIEADRVTLVGTSLGGHVAGYMTRLDHRHLYRLAMVGTLGIVALSERERLTISRILARRDVESCAAKLRTLVYDDALVTSELAREESLINSSLGTDETFQCLGKYFEDGLNNDLVLEDLRRCTDELDMGLMWGEQDVIISAETARQCMRELPELPMVWLRDTGHAPYFERPAAFVEGLNLLFDADRRAASEVTL